LSCFFSNGQNVLIVSVLSSMAESR
jgi:hypothetical protein